MTVGATVLKPGAKTELTFPYIMHPGMEGRHHFEVQVATNDPATSTLRFHVFANSVAR